MGPVMDPNAPAATVRAPTWKRAKTASGLRVLQWMLLGAALLAASALPRYWREMRSVKWPSVPGRIVESRIQEVSFRRVASYKPIIRFTFAVDGIEHVGNHVDFHLAERASTKDLLAPLLAKYPVGKDVKVFYDPGEPAFALLEPGIGGEQQGLYYLGLGFVTAGLVGFLLLARVGAVERRPKMSGAGP
ncbi:MAG: DUF3592 domain-containing protein [Myxococcales bacterium]